jgi:hypothetical protein
MLNRLRDKVRSLGWSDTAFFIAASLIRRASFGSARLIKYYFVAQPVPQRAREATRESAHVRMYVTSDTDAVITEAPRPLHVILDRLAQQARCVVAQRDDELAGFIWLCPGTYREDEVRCVYRWAPSEIAVWDFDVFIVPKFRMSRLFERLWAKAHTQLRSEGVAWTLSRVDAFNSGSLAAHRKLGARTLGRGWFLLAGQMQLAALSLSPFWHFSWRTDDPALISFDLSSLTVAPPETPVQVG